jgi:hypothetical protein
VCRPLVLSVGTGGAPTVGVSRVGVAGHGAHDAPEPCSQLQCVRTLSRFMDRYTYKGKNTDSDVHSLESGGPSGLLPDHQAMPQAKT